MNQLKTNYQHCLTMEDWRMKGKAAAASMKPRGGSAHAALGMDLTSWLDVARPLRGLKFYVSYKNRYLLGRHKAVMYQVKDCLYVDSSCNDIFHSSKFTWRSLPSVKIVWIGVSEFRSFKSGKVVKFWTISDEKVWLHHLGSGNQCWNHHFSE